MSGHELTVSSSSWRDTKTVKLAVMQCECHTGKYAVIARINSINIGIKLLTSGFLDIAYLVRMPISRGSKCPFCPPCGCPWLPHYEKGSSTNVGKLIIAKIASWLTAHRWRHNRCQKWLCPPPKFFAGCGPGSVIMSKNNIGYYWMLLWRVLILLWDKWPKCLSVKKTDSNAQRRHREANHTCGANVQLRKLSTAGTVPPL